MIFAVELQIKKLQKKRLKTFQGDSKLCLKVLVLRYNHLNYEAKHWAGSLLQ